MNLYINLSSRAAIADIGNSSPAPTQNIKSSDTAVLNVYFVLGGVVQDLGSGTALRFGLIAGNDPVVPLLVYDTTFNRMTDANGNVFYQGFPVFNNATLLGRNSLPAARRRNLPIDRYPIPYLADHFAGSLLHLDYRPGNSTGFRGFGQRTGIKF